MAESHGPKTLKNYLPAAIAGVDKITHDLRSLASCTKDEELKNNDNLLTELLQKFTEAKDVLAAIKRDRIASDFKPPVDLSASDVDAIKTQHGASVTDPSIINGKAKKRRVRDRVYDFLLLEILRQSTGEKPIGLSKLDDAARALDPNSKRDSLNAKLNKWKDDWVKWDDSEFRELMDSGVAARNKLRPFILHEAAQDKIKLAMKQIDLVPDFAEFSDSKTKLRK